MALADRAVRGDQRAAAGGLALDQLELGERGIVREQSPATTAGHDRADHQGELVQQAQVEQRADERRAAGYADRSALLLAQLPYEVGQRTGDQVAVAPLVHGVER